MLKNYKSYLPYFIIALLAFMPIIGHIDSLPIRLWDESRLAVNALEMLYNHNFIVTHYNGEPDLWNTKPPLMIWCQVLSMAIFGASELAIRLPSAIATIFTCLLLLIISKRYLHSDWFGIIAVLVLLTSAGYVHMHGSRSGDYDAMLTLFTTANAFAFFAFCQTNKTKYLYWFFATIILAVLTKSVAGLLFLPALLIYALTQKKVFSILKNNRTYIGFCAFLFFVAGYYLLRESMSPGYISAVEANEFGGRFNNGIEGHVHPFWYYYTLITESHFNYYYLLLPCGIALGLASKNKGVKNITLFSTIMMLEFFIVISTAQTKLEWYDMPMYPFMAIITAVGIHFVFTTLLQSQLINSLLSINVFPYLFLFLLFFVPYQKMFLECYRPAELDNGFVKMYNTSRFLQKAVQGKFDVNNKYNLHIGYNAHQTFYMNILKRKGVAVDFKYHDILDANDVVFTGEDSVQHYIDSNYIATQLHEFDNVITYKILGRKKDKATK